MSNRVRRQSYWSILDPQGCCIPDILSTVGEGDAWISLWNKRYPDSRNYSLVEFAKIYMEQGFKPVKLKVTNGK